MAGSFPSRWKFRRSPILSPRQILCYNGARCPFETVHQSDPTRPRPIRMDMHCDESVLFSSSTRSVPAGDMVTLNYVFLPDDHVVLKRYVGTYEHVDTIIRL
jgi:hypothetical protein